MPALRGMQTGGRQPRRSLLRESDIQATCSQLLELDGWRVLITDPCSDSSRGKGFGEKGMADALYIRYEHPYSQCRRVFAQVLWVEWKRRDGRIAANQDAWHAKERAAGALTWIAKRDFHPTIEGFWDFYKNSGLMRKAIALSAVSDAR